MKRVLITLAPLCILLAGFLVGRAASHTETSPTIALVFPGPVRFFSIELTGMRYRADELGLELMAMEGDWTTNRQLELIETALGRHVALVGVAPLNSTVVDTAADLAAAAGTPLVTFTNSDASDPTGHHVGVISHIGRNEFRTGELLGEQVALLGRPAPRIVTIEGTPGSSPQILRAAGFASTVVSHPLWKMVDTRTVQGWDLAQVEVQFGSLLRGAHFDVVVTQWAEAAIVVARMLHDAGRSDVAVVTSEWNTELENLIVDGRVASSTYFSIAGEGSTAIDVMSRVLHGEKVPPFVEITQTLVTAANAADHEPEW